MERLVDLLAAEVKMDPVDVRRKNFIPPFMDGHAVATGIVLFGTLLAVNATSR